MAADRPARQRAEWDCPEGGWSQIGRVGSDRGSHIPPDLFEKIRNRLGIAKAVMVARPGGLATVTAAGRHGAGYLLSQRVGEDLAPLSMRQMRPRNSVWTKQSIYDSAWNARVDRPLWAKRTGSGS